MLCSVIDHSMMPNHFQISQKNEAKASLHERSVLDLLCYKLTSRIVRIIKSVRSNDPYSGKSSLYLIMLLCMLGYLGFYFGVILFKVCSLSELC